jgi:endoplasmic reticulum Man9GlcNAc2 1,2-alpha-mannosidase
VEMWDQALAGIRKHLITYSEHANLTILAERPSGLSGALSPKMDHLVCFMPGTIALAVTEGLTLAEAKKLPTWDKKKESDFQLARDLMNTCWGMYKYTVTGLAPEITYFHISDPPKMMYNAVLDSPATLSDAPDADWKRDYDIHSADTHNLQRPETVESLFYFWRITKDERYREWGWQMFESFMKYTAVEETGFSSINDVTRIDSGSRDNMESFWLVSKTFILQLSYFGHRITEEQAETLKYFYLLFSDDDVLPLDKVVFNTEAHPFPKFELGKLFKTGWKRKLRDREGNIVPEPTQKEKEHDDKSTHS